MVRAEVGRLAQSGMGSRIAFCSKTFPVPQLPLGNSASALHHEVGLASQPLWIIGEQVAALFTHFFKIPAERAPTPDDATITLGKLREWSSRLDGTKVNISVLLFSSHHLFLVWHLTRFQLKASL